MARTWSPSKWRQRKRTSNNSMQHRLFPPRKCERVTAILGGPSADRGVPHDQGERMISENQIDDVQRATVYDRSGDKIGKAGQVYLDDATGTPTWITVNTGLFGTSESFVPLEGASFNGGDRVEVAYSKSQVKDAPRVAADGHLEVSEEAELYRYYGLSEGTTTTGGADYGTSGGARYATTGTTTENRTDTTTGTAH